VLLLLRPTVIVLVADASEAAVAGLGVEAVGLDVPADVVAPPGAVVAGGVVTVVVVVAGAPVVVAANVVAVTAVGANVVEGTTGAVEVPPMDLHEFASASQISPFLQHTPIKAAAQQVVPLRQHVEVPVRDAD
jgi:hypothetical protein